MVMPGRPDDVLKVPSGLRSMVGGSSSAGKVHRPVRSVSISRKEAGSSARQPGSERARTASRKRVRGCVDIVDMGFLCDEGAW